MCEVIVCERWYVTKLCERWYMTKLCVCGKVLYVEFVCVKLLYVEFVCVCEVIVR